MLTEGVEQDLAARVVKKLNCTSLGSCMLAADWITRIFLKNNITNFTVVEGYIKGKRWDSKDTHTWIQLNTGEIIDPTLEQFDKIGGGPFNYVGPYKRYTPDQYISLIKQYPTTNVKDHL